MKQQEVKFFVCFNSGRLDTIFVSSSESKCLKLFIYLVSYNKIWLLKYLTMIFLSYLVYVVYQNKLIVQNISLILHFLLLLLKTEHEAA